jgi:ATP phosphoribosyltransferase
MSGLVLALPSKGRLQEQTSARFTAAGLTMERDGARGYSARLPALPAVEVRLLSAGDIARALRDGDVHAGVTGEDLLRELGDGFSQVRLLQALGFGRADVVVAAPAAWLDVETMEDLDAAAAAMRARTGRRLRVATKFIALTRDFFARHGVDDYRIVESLGATEGAPASGAADVIVDITTTGATLRANHLRPLRDGVIVRSQAHLAASVSASWSAPALQQLGDLLSVFDAAEGAGEGRLLQADAAGRDLAGAAAQLADFGFAQDQAGAGTTAFRGPADSAVAAALALRAAGASDVVIQAHTHRFGRIPPALIAFRAIVMHKVAADA